MLKFDPTSRSLARLAQSTLAHAKILERADLQQSIVKSWDAFRNELGMPELILLGQEIVPHDSCKDRIDLLALDEQGCPVVIELKRGRDRLQMLQAVAYAGMIALWTVDEFRQRVAIADCQQADDINRLLEAGMVHFEGVRLLLLAETYDPEVIIGAHWLSRFDVPITAFTVTVVDHDGEYLVSLEQRYPLPELEDSYQARTRQRQPKEDALESWEDVLKGASLPWARHAVETLSKQKPGDPIRRRFGAVFASGQFGAAQMNIAQKHVKTYVHDQSPEQLARLRAALGDGVSIETWGSEQTVNSGYTFTLRTQVEFDRFVAAAKVPLGQSTRSSEEAAGA